MWVFVQYIYSGNCTDCNTTCNGIITDGKCIVYTGPNLPCSTINTNDSLELALQKIDGILCSTAGDYSTYNIHCISGPITTEAAFVSAITSYVCATNTSLTAFTGTTFPNYQAAVNTRFVAIEIPGITCASASVTNTNSLQQVLNAYCTKFASIDSNLNLSGVNWSSCFTVSTPPTTVHDAFSLIETQLCSVKALATSGGLPVFNNTGTCLPSPGASDSLVSTIGKLTTRVCQSPTLTNSTLSSSCTTIPGVATDLQTLLQNILNNLDNAVKAIPTYSSDFSVTNVSDGNLCLGKRVALATSLNVDRYVASDSSDTSPGTLTDKLTGGTGITLDHTTSPGHVIINGAAGTGDHKVLADSSDSSADYLDNKLNGVGDSNGLSLSTSYNGGTKKVDITGGIDLSILIPSLREYLGANPDEKALWCALFTDCPSPCSQPQNVSAVYISGSITTTSTTTTTIGS